MADAAAGTTPPPQRAWGSLSNASGRVRALINGAGGAGAAAAAQQVQPGQAAVTDLAQPRRKKSIFGQSQPADKLDPNSIEGHLLEKAKQDNVNVTDLIRNATISQPYDVEHKVKVRFDEENIRFSGIPEGWAAEAHKQFGIPLATCPRATVPGYKDRIPIVLIKLRDRFLELDGPRTEGVFRLAPDGHDVSDVKSSINTGQALQSLQTTNDPHVVANLIKQFYRELQPKILSSVGKEGIMEMAPITDNARIAAYVERLPEPYQSAFLWLLDLLSDVAEHQDTNRMTPTNLAIVLSPNLYDAGVGTAPLEELMLSQKVAAVTCNALKWRIATREGAGAAASAASSGTSAPPPAPPPEEAAASEP